MSLYALYACIAFSGVLFRPCAWHVRAACAGGDTIKPSAKAPAQLGKSGKQKEQQKALDQSLKLKAKEVR